MTKRKPRGYWTKEVCHSESIKYSTRNSFKDGSNGAYRAASNNGWLDEICSHMVIVTRYTKSDCATEAKKYKTRKDFQKSSGSHYNLAWRKNWLDEICSHMRASGSIRKRFVYEIKCEERNAVYVGLTCHPERRYSEHLLKSKRILESFGEGNVPPMTLVSELIDAKDAGLLESKLIADYHIKGYEVVNSVRGGGLGGGYKKWDKLNCKNEASKFESRGDFQKYSAGAYLAALNNQWLDEFFGLSNRVPIGYWNNKENCRKEASKHKNRVDFKKSCGGAYNSSLRNGWLDEICPPSLTRRAN